MRRNWREGGKKKADKNWILTAYDEEAADGDISAIATVNQGQAARTTASSGKGKKKSSKPQPKDKKKSFGGENSSRF